MSNGSLIISGDCKVHMKRIAAVELYDKQRKIKSKLWGV